MAIGGAVHEASHPHAARFAGERGVRADRVEARTIVVAELGGVEVGAHRHPVKPMLVREPPTLAQLLDRAELRPGVDAELHRRLLVRAARHSIRYIALWTNGAAPPLGDRRA